MKNKDATNSKEPPEKNGNSSLISKNSVVTPLFSTNTVTDATFRGEGNAPIPSGYAVREAKRYSREAQK